MIYREPEERPEEPIDPWAPAVEALTDSEMKFWEQIYTVCLTRGFSVDQCAYAADMSVLKRRTREP